jgi:hypothetical protein
MVSSLIDAIAICSDIQHTHMVAIQPFRVKPNSAPPATEVTGFRACDKNRRFSL